MIVYPAWSDPLSAGEVRRREERVRERASGFKGQIKSRFKWRQKAESGDAEGDNRSRQSQTRGPLGFLSMFTCSQR